MNTERKGKFWVSSLKMAFNTAGCNKDFSRLDDRQRLEMKAYLTGGNSTRKHVEHRTGHSRKHAASKSPAHSVHASTKCVQGPDEHKGSTQAGINKAKNKSVAMHGG